ncbi:hypothetical protein HDZ31DRAFT_68963 [Schizophyllum fasciatum]
MPPPSGSRAPPATDAPLARLHSHISLLDARTGFRAVPRPISTDPNITTIWVDPNAMFSPSCNLPRSNSALGHARCYARGPAIGNLGLPPTTTFASPNHRPHTHSASCSPQTSLTTSPLTPSQQDGETALITRVFACPPVPASASPQSDALHPIRRAGARPTPCTPSPPPDLAR